MRFLLLLVSDGRRWQSLPRAEQEAVVARHAEYERALTAAGKFLGCHALRPATEAKTVRIGDDGARLVTDGPYAETRESVGGYYVLDCASMDEAVEWARRLPNPFGGVEIREVEETP